VAGNLELGILYKKEAFNFYSIMLGGKQKWQNIDIAKIKTSIGQLTLAYAALASSKRAVLQLDQQAK